jgi:predicted ribosomally synthesized peptide with SipW-like signal peptide
MKKIIFSLTAIVVSASMAIGGTFAFFSDMEKSSGNTFTAGEIDLKIDSESHYSGLDCIDGEWTCERWADKAVFTQIEQGNRRDGNLVAANRSNPGVALGTPQSAGGPFETAVTGTFYSLGFGGTVTFRFENYIQNETGDDLKIYEITGGSTYPEEKAEVLVSQDGEDYTSLGIAVRDASFDLGVLPWVQYVKVVDVSDISAFPIPQYNDADGYDLDAIEALHCSAPGIYLAGQVCDGTWAENEFDETVHKFFNFDDVKPGDYGEDTISLHVYDNDAWGQLNITSIIDTDNGCVEPEVGVDADCQETGEVGGVGDLRANMDFSVWLDQGTTPGFQNGNKKRFDIGYDYEEGDNIYQAGLEPMIIEPGAINLTGETWNLDDALSIAFSQYCTGFAIDGKDNYGNGRLVASNSYYFGVAWELPFDTGNETQSDSFVADMVFVAEQHRNNATPFTQQN